MSKDLGKIGVDSSSKRRLLLKRLGLSATTGMLGGAALTQGVRPVAAGGGNGTTTNGTDVGTDQVIPAPDGAGLTNAEWNATNEEQDEQTSENIGSYSNAGELPIDYCVELPNGNEFCSSSDETVVEGPRDCGVGTTPVLFSTDITVQEYEYGNLKTGVSFWIGIDPETYCVWVGQEAAGACAKLACDVDEALEMVLDSASSWVDAGQGVIDWVDDNWGIIAGGVAFTALAIAVVVLPIATILAALLATISASIGS